MKFTTKRQAALDGIKTAVAVSGDNVLVYGEKPAIIGLLKVIQNVKSADKKTFQKDIMARRVLDSIRSGYDGFACVSDGEHVEMLIDGSDQSFIRNFNKLINTISLREGREIIRRELRK